MLYNVTFKTSSDTGISEEFLISLKKSLIYENDFNFSTIAFISITANPNFCLFIWKYFSATTKIFSIRGKLLIHNLPRLSALTNLVFRFTSTSLLQADNNDRAC